MSDKSAKTEKRASRAANAPAEGAENDADKCPPKGGQDASPALKQKPKKKRNYWALKITIISLVLSAFISFLTELTSSAENIIVTVILLLFLIMASILFDGIGVAVTSCDITPIVSMASKKEYGAKTALWLVKNNEKVSNVCNDVIGDIFGIISGACGAAIAIKIVTLTDDKYQQWIAIAVSAVISALTIGGKAFLKNIAISNSKEFVMFVARIIGVFHPEERRRKKKEAEKKKKYSAAESRDGKDGKETRDVETKQAQAKPVPRDKKSGKSGKSIKPVSVKAVPSEDVAADGGKAPAASAVPEASEEASDGNAVSDPAGDFEGATETPRESREAAEDCAPDGSLVSDVAAVGEEDGNATESGDET